MLRVVLALCCLAARISAQEPIGVPFGAGERLEYSVHGALGASGRGVMSMTGPVDVRGTMTLLASFTTEARVAFMRGHTVGRSWIDPTTMRSLRYVSDEKRPFFSRRDSVEIDPVNQHWVAASGDTGSTATPYPLDELSFIYFLRTREWLLGHVYTFHEFYDQSRTPTTVQPLARDTLRTSAGAVPTLKLQMRVKDAQRDAIEAILIWLSDDDCRIPVRIESTVKPLGTATLTLESVVTATCTPGPGIPIAHPSATP